MVRVAVYHKPWKEPTIWIDFLCIVPLALRFVVSVILSNLSSPLELYLFGDRFLCSGCWEDEKDTMAEMYDGLKQRWDDEACGWSSSA